MEADSGLLPTGPLSNLNTKHDNYQHIRDFRGWSQFLSSQYNRHLAKKTEVLVKQLDT